MFYLSKSFFEYDDHVISYIQSDMELEDEQVQSPLWTYTVTFKCIRATHDSSTQEALNKVSNLKREELFCIELHCEPDNQYDEMVQNGYMREALDHVLTVKLINASDFHCHLYTLWNWVLCWYFCYS